jgi:hypothetical protein
MLPLADWWEIGRRRVEAQRQDRAPDLSCSHLSLQDELASTGDVLCSIRDSCRFPHFDTFVNEAELHSRARSRGDTGLKRGRDESEQAKGAQR